MQTHPRLTDAVAPAVHRGPRDQFASAGGMKIPRVRRVKGYERGKVVAGVIETIRLAAIRDAGQATTTKNGIKTETG